MLKDCLALEGNIVTLKPLKEDFFESYHKMFSPTVRQAVGLSPTSELRDTATFLKATMSDPQHLMFYCIFDNQANKLIGSVVIRTPDYPNGQLGAWLNENFWGGGRYQEALYLALKKYFESTAYDSIYAFVEVGNERSLKAHQKMGFQIVEKLPEDKNRLREKLAHKFNLSFYYIVLTRAAFDKEQKI